jgi:hypothetical protein
MKVKWFQNVSRVGAILKKSKLLLRVIEAGVKNAKNLHGDNFFCFKQDSAPSHKAKRT